MEKIKSTINLLKTMLHTSYDTTSLIDDTTNKLNKKSVKLWLLIGVCILVIYLSNSVIGELKDIGVEALFLEVFFLLLQIIVIFQTILLGLNVMYFSEDIENYLYLPISNKKLQFTKFAVVMSIIFGTELIIVIPSLYIYGIKIVENILLYDILVVIVLFLISIFLATLVLVLMIPIMRIFRFIKNKYWYQTIVALVMTLIMITPMTTQLFLKPSNMEVEQNLSYYEENITQEENLTDIIGKITKANRYFIVSQLGVEILKENNLNSWINILKLLVLDIIVLIIYFVIGKATYIKDILWSLSIYDKKKKNKVNLNKKCKQKNKMLAFIKNDIADILKNPTFFMHYIYNVIVILSVIIVLSITIIPTIKQSIIENTDVSELSTLSFDFASFSIIIGIIQLVFTVSPISLTGISRYGKNAIFFKYIPIKLTTQFRLKNIPQLTIGIIIMTAILITIHSLFPEINQIYIIYMFVMGMLLNIIYSYILLLIDLKRPQLNNENEISVIQQNDNKLFKYIVTAIICVILWYLQQITKEVQIDIAIYIEIAVFSVILLILEFIINKKKDKLYEKIF